MPDTSLPSVWQSPDSTQYAALSFLARYRGDTLRAYTQDLRALLRRCDERAASLASAATAPGAVPALHGAAGLRRSDDRPAVHHGRRPLPLRRPGRALPERPRCGGDAAESAAGRATPHRPAPADVRRSAAHRPTGRTKLARAAVLRLHSSERLTGLPEQA